ncbi:MobA/MobL family protein [Sphingomonas palmae]|nr:MobA/MobL family protein [Sphingomonas palmae]
MLITKADLAAARRVLFAEPRQRPPRQIDFCVRPISQAWRILDRRPAYKTAVANAAYIWRDSSVADQFGQMPPSFAERRCELRGAGLALPESAPLCSTRDYTVWREADDAAAATGDPSTVSAWHIIAEIPEDFPAFLWRALTTRFVMRELLARGAAVAWAIHALNGEDGWIVKPHRHFVVTARYWRHDRRQGARHPAWMASTTQQKKLQMVWRRDCAATDAIGRCALAI